LSRKTVHKSVEKFSRTFESPRWCLTRCWNGSDNSQRLLCCRFRRTGKAMGQVYQCWWRICREITDFFQVRIYNMFYGLYPFVTYLLTLPRICGTRKSICSSILSGTWTVGNILLIKWERNQQNLAH
jgi:hypothetical protein